MSMTGWIGLGLLVFSIWLVLGVVVIAFMKGAHIDDDEWKEDKKDDEDKKDGW